MIFISFAFNGETVLMISVERLELAIDVTTFAACQFASLAKRKIRVEHDIR